MSALAVAVQPCEPWCQTGEKAHAEERPDDRCCVRDQERVPLTRHQAMLISDGKFWHDHLDVYLSRWQEGSPELWLHHVGPDTEIRMTIEEAEDLLDVLRTAPASVPH